MFKKILILMKDMECHIISHIIHFKIVHKNHQGYISVASSPGKYSSQVYIILIKSPF